MKDTMILKDGTAIELEAGAVLGAIQVYTPGKMDMLQIWEKMTEENLSDVQIQNGNGMTVGTYKDLVLVSETSVVALDGTVNTTYSLREKTDVEKRLDSLENGQEIQNGAIGDLGEAVGTLADGGEL